MYLHIYMMTGVFMDGEDIYRYRAYFTLLLSTGDKISDFKTLCVAINDTYQTNVFDLPCSGRFFMTSGILGGVICAAFIGEGTIDSPKFMIEGAFCNQLEEGKNTNFRHVFTAEELVNIRIYGEQFKLL